MREKRRIKNKVRINLSSKIVKFKLPTLVLAFLLLQI